MWYSYNTEHDQWHILPIFIAGATTTEASNW